MHNRRKVTIPGHYENFDIVGSGCRLDLERSSPNPVALHVSKVSRKISKLIAAGVGPVPPRLKSRSMLPLVSYDFGSQD